jgi:hypothetical protein
MNGNPYRFLFSVCGLCLLSACGGDGSSAPLPPPSATHFSVSAPAAATAGTAVSVTVTALDASNRAVTAYSGTVHFTSTDARAELPGNSALTNGTGTVQVRLQTAGRQTITTTDSVTAAITGTSSSIMVSGGAAGATHFSVTAPGSATIGTAFSITVTALDASNKPVTAYSGTVLFRSTDGTAGLPGGSSLTNGTGILEVTLNSPGSQTITATDSVTASISGTSNLIQVSAPVQGPTGSMGTPREAHRAILLNDGRVLVVGGMHWSGACARDRFCCPTCGAQLSALASAELFDAGPGQFTPTGGMSAARVFLTATLLANGQVLITGGDDRRGTTYATAELFDPATGLFTLTGEMGVARSAHTATLLGNGKVLVAGGAGATGNLSSAELFDPATGQFTPAGNMTTPRFFHTATRLDDGRVLLVGGDGGGESTAELYDPATRAFTSTGGMSVGHVAHTATLLANGMVLVAGGASSAGVTATAELFNPVSGAFTLAGTMLSARESHTATRRTDGKVLVTGGIAGNTPLSAAELFDPANGTFVLAMPLETARYEHTATLLTDGEVLIAGGINSQGPQGLNSLATAELLP